MVFWFVWLVITFDCHFVSGVPHRLFNTMSISKNKNNFDCLIGLSLASISNINKHPISAYNYYREAPQFCRRSTSSIILNTLTETNHSKITFEQLRSMNTTSRELFQWYAPIDLIEEYIAGVSTGEFVNCSDTMWFGLNCEYAFYSDDYVSEIRSTQSLDKIFIPTDLSSFTNGTCYEMHNTDCESIICLDWREICDGKIDCKNGYDEYRCEELEMNECDPTTEYRCLNGECIDDPGDSVLFTAMCFEQYYATNADYIYCYYGQSILCENRKCPRLSFSCGDGYCYDGPSIDKYSCPTQRDQRYLQRMPSSTTLVLFSHVIINYTDTQPEYICFNQSLCPYLSVNKSISIVDDHGLTCRAFETFTNRTYQTMYDMIVDIKRLVRSCSLLPFQYNNPYMTCSMFRCNDGSKCLSFHRLSDGTQDCTNDEDENQLDVCSYNLSRRFTCDHGKKCIPEKLFLDDKNDCADSTDENALANVLTSCSHPFSTDCHRHIYSKYLSQVNFYHICNGLLQYGADSNNNTDESDCSTTEWPCDGYYGRCDNLWNCPDGRDELGCLLLSRSYLYCNNSAHFCLRNETGQPMCLPAFKVNDDIIDCVGSFDERDFCRQKYPFELKRRYRCQNSSICISINSVCNCQQDCPENDDETIACWWSLNGRKCNPTSLPVRRCSRDIDPSYDGRFDIFCDLEDNRNQFLWGLHHRRKSPRLVEEYRMNQQQSENNVDNSIIWSCNRGLVVRSRKDPEGFACFCPEYYYGHRCEYQRKRISINLQMRPLTAFNQQISPAIFVLLLIHYNQSNPIILSHVQFITFPHSQCWSSPIIQILYPIDEQYRSLTNNSVHIHMFDRETFRHQKLWIFPLKFEFLPVQQLFKRLDIPELLFSNAESIQSFTPHTSCTSCSNQSLCIGRDVSLDQDICLCPSNYAGHRCLLPFNPCNNINCSGHGTCVPTELADDPDDQFMCLCEPGWGGFLCEKYYWRIDVLLAQDVAFLSSKVAFLHVTYEPYFETKTQDIYVHRLSKETLNMTFFLDRSREITNAAFIQFYEHSSKFDFYLLFYYLPFESQINETTTITLRSTHRCRSIKELFDGDILAQSDIRRVKNYQRPCVDHKDSLLCFYDDHLMCLCRKNNYTDCIKLETNLKTCENKWCSDRGMCVVNDRKCLTYSRCICDECAYGSICQFSTQGYTLSLDGIIGSHISLSASNLSQQSTIVRTAVTIILIVILLGIILNILSISTFVQKETHEVGCGLYLLVSSLVGLLTTMVVLCKMIILLVGERSHISCALVEFFLEWCPASCEWLNACVALERAIAVKRGVQYSRSRSKSLAKWVTAIVLVLVACICLPDAIFREIIIDVYDERAWCVLKLNREQPGLLAMYSILNILSFLIPLVTNLVSGILIILTTLKIKEKAMGNKRKSVKDKMTWRTRFRLIRRQIDEHKHVLIAPLVLGLLSLPRLALTFIFTCTKLDEKSLLSLCAYLVGFLPSMAIIFAFVCPSQAYRAALLKSLKAIIPKYCRNQ